MHEHGDPFFFLRARLEEALSADDERAYVRFVALGDSATSGLGNPSPGGVPISWARFLTEAISRSHDVSFCNVAVAGSTAADVWQTQLPEALRHRAQFASLIVGLNDTMRASWDTVALRAALLMSAAALTSRGAILDPVA